MAHRCWTTEWPFWWVWPWDLRSAALFHVVQILWCSITSSLRLWWHSFHQTVCMVMSVMLLCPVTCDHLMVVKSIRVLMGGTSSMYSVTCSWTICSWMLHGCGLLLSHWEILVSLNLWATWSFLLNMPIYLSSVLTNKVCNWQCLRNFVPHQIMNLFSNRVEHSRQNRPILKPKSLQSKLNLHYKNIFWFRFWFQNRPILSTVFYPNVKVLMKSELH